MGIFNWISSQVKQRAEAAYCWVIPRGRPDPKTEEIKRAVRLLNVAAMEAEDRKYFRQDGPGKDEDAL